MKDVRLENLMYAGLFHVVKQTSMNIQRINFRPRLPSTHKKGLQSIVDDLIFSYLSFFRGRFEKKLRNDDLVEKHRIVESLLFEIQ